MKHSFKRFLSLVSMLSLVVLFALPVHAEGGDAPGDYDLSSRKQESSDVFFTAYVYLAENKDNPYQNSAPDVTVHFTNESGEEYYMRVEQQNYKQSYLWKDFNYIWLKGYLPKGSYSYQVTTSDTNGTTIGTRSKYGNTDISQETKVDLTDRYNEFFTIVGDPQTMDNKETTSLLSSLYDLCHSESQDINDTKAYKHAEEEELLKQIAEAMKNDPSMEQYVAGNGTVYTRKELTERGLLEADDTKKEEDAAPVVDSEKKQDDTESIPELPQKEQEKTLLPFPPIVLVILVALFLAAIVAIAKIKKDKRDSDLTID